MALSPACHSAPSAPPPPSHPPWDGRCDDPSPLADRHTLRAPTLHLAAHPAPHPARRRRLGSLNDNAIGDEGAVALAEALESNCVLSTLNLARNDIGGDVSARPPQSDPRC